MKQAIVDKNAAVSSAALVSAYHVAKYIPEGVKRWINEVQAALNSGVSKVEFHALGLELDDQEGYDDEYPLEDFEVSLADYMQRITKNNFTATWEQLGEDTEVQETYSLSAYTSIEEAMKNVICFMGMQPCDRTDKLQHGKQTSHHNLKLTGFFRGEEEVLVEIKLAIDIYNPDAGVTMQISVRCKNSEIAEFIAATIQ
ncbi:hypothetical protein RND71_043749 [Anisodus tanguticus]|uniref:Coatomer subunit gamma C-terminal domain-containing protein n=1 Tax=Anisodus tanguticus TaxID=243964 RepID=A0AAE1UMW5_9SOLA|nr:hypothetical protein RND71_043749 [Anisodus tanguticus]